MDPLVSYLENNLYSLLLITFANISQDKMSLLIWIKMFWHSDSDGTLRIDFSLQEN